MDNPQNPQNRFEDFPIGSHVKIICDCQDHYFFWGETGVVIKNSGKYLGIIVQFDEPRKFTDGHIQVDFNFAPADLELIDKKTMKQKLNGMKEKLDLLDEARKYVATNTGREADIQIIRAGVDLVKRLLDVV